MAKSKFWDDYAAGTVKTKAYPEKKTENIKRSSFWDDYEAGTVKKKVDDEKETRKESDFWSDYAAGTVKREYKSPSKGEIHRSSTKDSDGWLIPGKTVRPENQRVNASVRTAAEVQADVDALDEKIAELEDKLLVTNMPTYKPPKSTRQRDEQNKFALATLENSRERLKQERSAAKTAEYDALRDAEDYTKNSGYHSTRTETASGEHRPITSQSGVMSGVTGYDDWIYEYINKNPDVLDAVKEYRKGQGKAASAQGYDLSFLEQMDEDEVRTYNYLYAVQGKEAAQGFLDYIRTDPYYEKGSLNKRQRKATETAYREFAEENPVAASAVSVLQTPATVTSYAGQVVNTLLNGETDPNASYNKAVYTKSAARDAVAGKIEESLGETWGPIGSFGYQVGMSMGDFLLANALTGGAGTSFVLGSNAAADVTLNALDKGVDSKDALALGAVAGLAEYATEKLSVDQLFNSSWEENALKYLFKNAFTEMEEEAVSSVINTISDILLSGDKSEWRQAYSAYRKQGFDEREAFSKTFVDHLKQVGLDALGGAISGSLMAGGNIVVGSAAKSAERKTNQAHGATHQSIYDIDTENTKTGNATDHLGAVNDALNAAQTADPADSVQKAAEYVRTIQDAKPNTENAVNTAVDFVREKIRMYNDLIKTTKDETLKAQYQQERETAIKVDKTLRSHRAEIDEIIAKTPTQTNAETRAEQPKSASSETITETVTEDESTAEETPAESESEAQEEEETPTERPTVSQEFRRSFEHQTGSLYGSSASSAARNLVAKTGSTAKAAEILNSLDRIETETDASEAEHNEMREYISDIRSSVLEMAEPEAERLAATASAALKKYGVSVVVDTDEASVARYQSGDKEGWYDGEAREIHVSPFVSDETTFGRVVLHEFTHHAEVADNTLVNEITGAIGRLTDKKAIDPGRYDFKRYSTIYSGDAEQYLSTKSGAADVAAYIKNGMNETEARAEVRKNYINGEIAADFMGDLMENQSFMQTIKKDDRSFLQKIHDLLRGLAARLTGNAEVWKFEQAADKIRAVLQARTKGSVKPRTKNASRKRVETSDTERASRRVLSDEERAKMREQERKEWLERQLVQVAADGSEARALSVAQKDRIVSELAAEMDGVTHQEVRDTIKDVFNVIEHPKATTKAEIAQEINDAAHRAAETLYSQFKAANINPLAEQYGDLYSKIRATKLNITDEIRTEIPEWPQYYKSIFGKIHLVKDGGMSVDSFYNEVSANYPEVFSREVTNEGEQLQRLVEVAEELRPVAGHPFYDASPAEESAHIDSIAGAIIAKYRQYSSETVAAQNRRLRIENKKLSQETEKARVYATDARATVQWYQAEAESMNLDFVNSMNALQRKIDAAEAETERIRKRVVLDDQKARFDSERRRAESVLDRINRRLQNPSKRNRIPAELRSAVVSFFDAAKGSGVVSTGTTAAQEEQNLSRYANYASRVVNVMKNLSESPKGDTPDYLAVTEDALKMLTQRTSALWSAVDAENAPDAEQSVEIMRQFADICEMVDYHLRNADKVFMGNKKINAEKFSMDWRKDLKSCKPVLLAKQEYESESSAQFLGTLGREGEQISTALNEAQDLQMQRQAEYATEVIKLFGGEKYNTFDASIKGKQIKVTINGAELVTSRAQLMTVHALWRRPAGRRHLMYGGANFVNAKGETRSDRQFRIDKKTYEQLMTHLSARDKQIAEGLSRILSEVCGTWGNDASMKLYGIMLYNDPLYFPIVGVDDAFSASWDFMSKDSGSDMPGFSRKVDPNAVNPIKIMDIFDVADSHAMRMASWSAFAPVTDGIRRIMSVSGTKTALTDKFGKPAWDYIDNLLNNIKENKMMDEAESLSLLKKMESNYKRQAVSSSLSSAAKQFLSLPRVLGEIDAKYLVAANPVGAEYERAKSEMIKNSGLAKIKALGYSDLAIGRTIRSQYDPKYIPLALDFTKFPVLNKVYRGAKWLETKESQFGSIPAETADLLTEVRIWKACELETDDKYKGLSPEERTRRITARFNDILGKTQVVDSVLSTSPLARNPFYKMVAPFTSETIKNNGWIYSAYRNWRNGRPGAKKHLAGVLALSGITYSVLSPAVSAMFSALRDENDEETLEEALKRFLYYYLGWNPEADTEKGEKVWNIEESYVVQEFTSSVPVPLLSILINIGGDALSGYETSRLDSEAFSNFMKKLSNYQKKAEQEPYKSTKTEFALGYEVITATSQLLGSSFNNIQRDLRAFVRSIVAAIPTSEARKLRWEYNKWFYNLSNASARSQKNFYDLLVDAYNNGDMETYQTMLHDLQGLQTSQKQRGVSWSTMQKNIEEHGGKIEVGSPMWNVTVQSQFNLDTFVTNMKVESAIADVYQNALAAGADDSQAGKAIYKIPSNESFIVYEGDEDDEDRKKIDVQMPYMDYERYTDDAGQYAYALVGRMVASGDWKELSWKQQLYALDKAYTYARAFYRHKYDSRYEINTKWMMEMIDGEERPNETASEILSHAADQDE